MAPDVLRVGSEGGVGGVAVVGADYAGGVDAGAVGGREGRAVQESDLCGSVRRALG